MRRRAVGLAPCRPCRHGYTASVAHAVAPVALRLPPGESPSVYPRRAMLGAPRCGRTGCAGSARPAPPRWTNTPQLAEDVRRPQRWQFLSITFANDVSRTHLPRHAGSLKRIHEQKRRRGPLTTVDQRHQPPEMLGVAMSIQSRPIRPFLYEYEVTGILLIDEKIVGHAQRVPLWSSPQVPDTAE